MADYIFSEGRTDETTLRTLILEKRPNYGPRSEMTQPWPQRSPHGLIALKQPLRRMRRLAPQWLSRILQVDGYAAYNRLARSAAMMASHWLAAGQLQTQVTRAACCRELGSRNGDAPADGEALAGRENGARSKPRHLRCRAPASVRGDHRRSLRSLGADLAPNLRQIKTGYGDPLCRLAPCHLPTS